MATVRVRRNVLKLPGGDWDPVILWYARAVRAMQQKSLDDPTSWRYQGAIHGFNPQLTPPKPGEQILSTAPGGPWVQCQHGSWYFLPWHRMYLTYFERIVAATVQQLGGPADWALPYWNYSDKTNPNATKLPPAFRATSLPDGTPNSLRIPQRARGNSGNSIVTPLAVDLTNTLSAQPFVGLDQGPDPGFGGPATAFHHPPGPMGELENSPHGTIHVQVGGFMNDFDTAALDPIFWLHHCNIDRLWVVWRKRTSTHLDPTDPRWLTRLSFTWQDGSGGQVTLTPSQVVETTATPLSYDYDDVGDPLAGPAAPPQPERREAVQPSAPRPQFEMVGASQSPVTLTGQPTSTELAVAQPSGPARAAMAPGATAPSHAFLQFENVTGGRSHTSYAVYVNLPSGADPAQNEDHFVGVLSLFGVEEASRAAEQQSGTGLQYSLPLGRAIPRLQARNAWDPSRLRVTFVPVGPEPEEPEPGLARVAESGPVHIGRVSLHYA